jgi:serine/threonine protein kinase
MHAVTYQFHVQMTEVADGLVYLHDQKVVHGDINDVRASCNMFCLKLTKPQTNILISDEEHAQLADFGLAIISEQTEAHMTQTSTNAGSVAWMSPEQLDEEHHRRCTADDVYAFGCLGYFVSPITLDCVVKSILWTVLVTLWHASFPQCPCRDHCIQGCEGSATFPTTGCPANSGLQ